MIFFLVCLPEKYHDLSFSIQALVKEACMGRDSLHESFLNSNEIES